jgi:hypothetical protein
VPQGVEVQILFGALKMQKQVIQIIKNEKIREDIYLALIPIIVFFITLLLAYFLIKSNL